MRAPGRSGGRLELLAAAALFSTGGVAIKSTALSAWQVASLRSGVATLLTIGLLLLRDRRLPRLTPRSWLVGVAYATTLICFVVANKLTTAASAIFLQATAPLYVLLLSPWLLRERIRRPDLLLMGFLLLGMVLFWVDLEPASVTAPDPARGNVIAIASGFFWGLTLIGLRWLSSGRDEGAGSAGVICGNTLAFLGALPLALPFGTLAASDLAAVSYLGSVQIALAYLFLTSGMRRVPAFEASLLLLLEPVLSALWAWLIYRERLSLASALGALLILASTVGKTWVEMRGSRVAAAGVA
ncbi:MAG TPA: DMT family transporter [Thermoanaerobaculia bacterium]|nr:DMT family transporter [Thermoanaerobaculia bacterium]